MNFKEAINGLYKKNTWGCNVILTCGKCGYVGTPAITINDKNMLRADCISCEHYIKWLPQEELYLVSINKAR